MSDETPSDAVRVRALEMAFLGILPFLRRDSLEHAESNMASQEARAVGDERAAARAAGKFFATAIGWHLEADDDAGLVGPDTPEDPQEVAEFDEEVERLIRVETLYDPGPEGIERVADAIMAVPSTIVTRGNMYMRERLAEALRKRAAEARGA